MTGLLPAPRTPLESPAVSVGLDFVAFDVETANSRRGSICAIGAAVVRGGVVVSTHSWLTRPPAGLDHFDGFNVGLHGITPGMVADQPAFPERLDVATRDVVDSRRGDLITKETSGRSGGA